MNEADAPGMEAVCRRKAQKNGRVDRSGARQPKYGASLTYLPFKHRCVFAEREAPGFALWPWRCFFDRPHRARVMINASILLILSSYITIRVSPRKSPEMQALARRGTAQAPGRAPGTRLAQPVLPRATSNNKSNGSISDSRAGAHDAGKWLKEPFFSTGLMQCSCPAVTPSARLPTA